MQGAAPQRTERALVQLLMAGEVPESGKYASQWEDSNTASAPMQEPPRKHGLHATLENGAAFSDGAAFTCTGASGQLKPQTLILTQRTTSTKEAAFFGGADGGCAGASGEAPAPLAAGALAAGVTPGACPRSRARTSSKRAPRRASPSLAGSLVDGVLAGPALAKPGLG